MPPSTSRPAAGSSRLAVASAPSAGSSLFFVARSARPLEPGSLNPQIYLFILVVQFGALLLDLGLGLLFDLLGGDGGLTVGVLGRFNVGTRTVNAFRVVAEVRWLGSRYEYLRA